MPDMPRHHRNEHLAFLVDLIVKEQFINACSDELAMYLFERGPKDMVE